MLEDIKKREENLLFAVEIKQLLAYLIFIVMVPYDAINRNKVSIR
jgi:hypothetical protein